VQYDYDAFSQLTGPIQQPFLGLGGSYEMRYRRTMTHRDRLRIFPLLLFTLLLSSLFFLWLIQPAHYPNTNQYLGTVLRVANITMFVAIVVTEGLRLLNSMALCWSAWLMRDPIPVSPEPGHRIAFTTTFVPSKEPLEIVRRTLTAARRINYDGLLEVWLLDEGNDPDARRMCRELGVRHFSRHGHSEWNTRKGTFKARTKHGNHNAWLAAHGDDYDFVLSVDPDHIPQRNFAERMLGYFRDPDVAFVVGPQVYGNFDNFLTRAAEAQNYMFHSVVQRSANRWECGMFVGTNHAYRVSAWKQVGGFQDSITEDLATSLVVHGARNVSTGRNWKSVYTPDVLAVGEGPASWTDFFSQQLRWARGANEVLVTTAAGSMRRLSWMRRLHYSTIMLHYPTIALTWLLGMLLTFLYMVLGSTGIAVHVSSWLALYVDVFLARLVLYFWFRKYNVSPHEEPGTGGISGIFVSVLCTPMYSAAFTGAVLRRPLGFVVTPKGENASPDRMRTFRKHAFWSVWSIVLIVVAASLGHVYSANMIWACASFLVCILPILMWRSKPTSNKKRPVYSEAATEEIKRLPSAPRQSGGAPAPASFTFAEDLS
jgi:cellulose synthase/poly-beta-1,6-N-acetylglucosamine synthase-like glycosyltransferase